MTFMSLPEPAPTRVNALIRLLRSKPNNREIRDTLEKTVMPESILNGGNRNIVTTNITECINAGILKVDNEYISLNDETLDPDQPNYKRRLTNILIGPESNGHNQDMGKALAWFLTLNVTGKNINFRNMELTEEQLPLMRELGLNDVRFPQLCLWATYLGFAWPYDSSNSQAWMPDPSQYISFLLDDILPSNSSVSVTEVMTNLSKECSVLEGGGFRQVIEKLPPVKRPDQELSTATSFAWHKLETLGKVSLINQGGDFQRYTFLDNPRSSKGRIYTHIQKNEAK